MADSMDPTQDLLSQIAQRLQPVAPKASGFYTPTLAERQAQIDAAQGHATSYGGSALSTPEFAPRPQTGPVAPTGLTQTSLADRQAAINAAQGHATQYGGAGLDQRPLAVRQAEIYAAQGGPNLYSGNALTPYGQAFKQAYTPTEAQLARLQANPVLATQYVNKANQGAQRVADMTARQQQYLRLQALRNSAQRNAPGQFDRYLMPAMKLAMGFL
jgi:hypothetical protein